MSRTRPEPNIGKHWDLMALTFGRTRLVWGDGSFYEHFW